MHFKTCSQVLIIGHVPPGFSTPRGIRFMESKFNKKFVNIVLRHAGVIAALHFGHEHRDAFKIFYNSPGMTYENKTVCKQ